MSIQELCLIPKSIVEKLMPEKPPVTNNTSDKIQILREEKKLFSSKNHKSDLTLEISKIFTSKNKTQKALNVYSWIINNTPDIEIGENGQLIKPLKQINIFDFIKDVYSTNKNFTKDKLDLYKIFIAWINLPSDFLTILQLKIMHLPKLKIRIMG